MALRLASLEGCAVHPHDVDGGGLVAIGPSSQLSIIGFPFGRTGGGAFGIWVQGTVATEPAVNFDDLPCFLIDSRTRSGQSGSPVIFYQNGGSIPTSDGGVVVSAAAVEELLGVYSGRISPESDLGVVWRREVIRDIIDGGVRGVD